MPEIISLLGFTFICGVCYVFSKMCTYEQANEQVNNEQVKNEKVKNQKVKKPILKKEILNNSIE